MLLSKGQSHVVALLREDVWKLEGYVMNRIAICFIVLILSTTSCALGQTTRPDRGPFRVIVLPDTQVYSWGFPHVFEAQTKWIVDHAADLDIRFVSHVGDVVDGGGDDKQWRHADRCMKLLDDANVPYGILPGNHDWARTGRRSTNLDSYLAVFGPERFEGRDWYGGSMPGRHGNSWQTFDGGGLTFLHLALEWRHDFDTDPDLGILEWAQTVIDAHPGLPTIITTHEDLRDNDKHGRDGGVTAPGVLLFDDLLRTNDQVFLVLSGHNHFGPNKVNGDGEWRHTSTTDNGLAVHRLMTTFQDWRPNDSPTGGEGFLRIMTFDVAAGEVKVETYSPFRDTFLTDGEGPTASQFVIPIDFATRFAID